MGMDVNPRSRRSLRLDRPSTRPRLQTQLLLLLLLFGAVPVVLVAGIGYSVSRRTIISRSETALSELANRQASYLQTELRREQLILRTIAGQVAPIMARDRDADVSALLAGGLATDGVFDGLRVLDPQGTTMADVALRETDPNWPEDKFHDVVPGVALHIDADSVIAYLLTVRLVLGDQTRWLQGHVRSADFARNFDIPLHVLGGVELGLFDSQGHTIFISHAHADRGLQAILNLVTGPPGEVVRSNMERNPALGFATELPELNWTMVTALPLSIVLAPVNNLLLLTAGGCTLLVLLIVAAGHVASRHVTTPLRELSAATATFGETGSYDTIVHRGVAETQSLIESFQAMADRLRRSRAEVEQLHGRELERAQQLATVGELASGVAHEIRNPLTGVIGALEIVRRKLKDADATAPIIDEARAQLHRIESTTTQLLEYARPPELRLIGVDLIGVVARAMRVVQATAEKAGVTLVASQKEKQLLVRADPELIVQVLVNLLLNGVDVTSRAGELRVELVRRSVGIEVRVQDHGAGVPQDKLQAIFRPFFTTKHQGTGLGLSISQQIVGRHGGTMWVESTPGGGATFVVLLPAIETVGE